MRQIIPKARRIMVETSPDTLENDLQELCSLAAEKGAAHAIAIKKDQVVFNDAIKKIVENHDSYPSIHWPVSYPSDDLENSLKSYNRGILFAKKKPKGMTDFPTGPVSDPEIRKTYFAVYDIAGLIESAAFYKGYHLSLSLAAGNCRSIFCPDEKRCMAMLKGRTCIHPYKSRPSMEAAGIDPAGCAKNAGIPMETINDYLYGILFVC